MIRLWQGFVRFTRGVFAMPPGWTLWVLALVAVNLAAPLFFLDRVEARAALAAIVIAGVLIAALTAWRGFTRLLGAGHVLWLGLVPWIISRWPLAPANEPFGVWLRVLVAFNVISLAFDLADVLRYASGERGETI